MMLLQQKKLHPIELLCAIQLNFIYLTKTNHGYSNAEIENH